MHAYDDNGGWSGFAGAGNTSDVQNLDVVMVITVVEKINVQGARK